MSANKEDKRYGLIVPKKPQLSAPKPGNIFGDNNDSDEDEGTDWVKKALKAAAEKNLTKKQTQLDMQKALNEDPTIYQYDEVYDNIERNKVDTKAKKKEIKKPKYITNLLKTAERRKIEQEHRIERMVQKEREKEGAEFADKESFVTSAYRAKLEEFKKLEEEEAKMDRLETIGDVTKQKDMSGFYRHLYKQTVENVSVDCEAEEENTENKKETNSNDLSRIDTDIDQDSSISTDSESEVSDKCKEREIKKTDTKSLKSRNQRQYRKRAMDMSDSESEHETKPQDTNKNDKLKKVPNSELHKDEIQKTIEPDKKKQKVIEAELKELKNEITEAKTNDDMEENLKSTHTKQDSEENQVEKTKQPPQRNISIWVKRTVGPVFEAALQRYYERKAVRLSGM